MIATPFLTVALAAPLFLPGAAGPPQRPGQTSEQPAFQQPTEYLVEYYQPQRANVNELQSTLMRLAQSMVMTTQSGTSSGADPLLRYATFQSYGGTLLVYAPSTSMPGLMELARRMDDNYVRPDQAGREELVQHQYRVRHVSLDSAEQALRFLDRNTMQQMSPIPAGMRLSYVDGAGLVLMSGTQSYVDQARAVLAELDVPRPSLMVTCYLLRGRGDAQSSQGIPPALARDLAALVPYEGFTLLSSGMLPTDGAGPMLLRVDLEDEQGTFELGMTPAAYDPQTGILALDKLSFELELNGVENSGVGEEKTSRRTVDRRFFTTSTSLATDRYSVVGAVGEDPVFVVVRLTQVAR